MDGSDLAMARRAAGITQADLAHRCGTSRETISAYEHNRKSPTLETMNRLLAALGRTVEVGDRIEFVSVPVPRGRPISVPSALPRLPAHRALAVVTLPLHLDWSATPRVYDLADRRQRGLLYEVVLREGAPDDVLRYIDGALLVDLWPDLVLPPAVRSAWAGLIQRHSDAA